MIKYLKISAIQLILISWVNVFAIEVICGDGRNPKLFNEVIERLDSIQIQLEGKVKILEIDIRHDFITIYGLVDGKKIKIADAEVYVRGKMIEFHRDVQPIAREVGLGDVMVKTALLQNPQVTQIHHFLIDLNRDIFYKNLLEKSKLLPSRLSKSLYGNYSDYFYKFGHKYFEELPSGEQRRLITEAIYSTPAYKSGAKFGFKNICPDSIKMNKSDRVMVMEIEFSTCK